MPGGQAGTVELLARELALALAALEQTLSRSQVRALLARLGVQFPPELESDAALTDAVSSGSAAASALPPLLTQLSSAVEAEDAARIGARGLELVAQIKRLVEALDAIARRLDAMAGSLPGVTEAQVRDLAEAFARRVVSLAIVDYLDAHYPRLSSGLALTGLVERVFEPGDPDDPSRPSFERTEIRLDRLADLVRSPSRHLEALYGWGTASFDGRALLEQLFEMVARWGLPASFTAPGAGVPAALDLFVLRLRPDATATPPGLELELHVAAEDGFRTSTPLWPGARLEVGATGEFEQGLTATVAPPARFSVVPPRGPLTGELYALLSIEAAQPGGRVPLLALASGTGITADLLTARAGVTFTWDQSGGRAIGDVQLQAIVTGGRAALRLAQGGDSTEPDSGDGFLQSVLPRQGLEANFELGVGWSSDRGLYFFGGAGLETTIPVHKSALGVSVDSVYLALRPGDRGLATIIALTGTLQLGPLTVTIDRLGLLVDLIAPPAGGRLADASLALKFKPPEGAGLAVDAGPVVGGGYLFFDPARQEYAGILILEFEEKLALTAVGLITTRMPDGSRGFSLLIIVSAQGFAPIQLGYGFTLNGVGGLLGLNRTVAVEVLRAGIKTGSLDSVLFPEDPLRDAPQIISTLRAAFPPAPNRFLIGPMAIIGWGTPALVTLELGIVIELPAPVRVVIVGQLRAALPSEEAGLVVLKMDVLGIVDFGRREVSVDATLYDSRLVQYALTGDMALRSSWGATPTFALAVGGLHPRFQPPPGFPTLERIAVALATGDNPRIRMEGYLALTANTAQVGARLEIAARQGRFRIEGLVGFDALFHFDPFAFVGDVGGRVAVRAAGKTVASVGIDMTLTGPRPWHAWGRARFEVLGMKHSVRFDVSFGPDDAPPLPAPVDVGALLASAVADPRSWNGELPGAERPLVSLRPVAAPQATLVHPLADLTLRQRVVPLDVTISRFGQTRPAGEHRFTLRDVTLGGGRVDAAPVTEAFAPAQFFEMTDDEALSRPSFEPLTAGVRLTGGPPRFGEGLSTPIRYETYVLDPLYAPPPEPAGEYTMPAETVPGGARLGAAGRAALRRTGRSRYRTAGRPVAVNDAIYSVVGTEDLRPAAEVPGVAEGVRMTYTTALDALRGHLAENPGRRGALQVATLGG